MANLNEARLIGNITQDIELKYTPSGMAVINNSLAINNIRVVNEEKVEDTTFVEFTVWGSQAENLSKFQKKGSNILILGHLQLDTWEDKETKKTRSKLSVVADRIQYLGGLPKGDQAENGTQPQPTNTAPQQLGEDGKIPF